MIQRLSKVIIGLWAFVSINVPIANAFAPTNSLINTRQDQFGLKLPSRTLRIDIQSFAKEEKAPVDDEKYNKTTLWDTMYDRLVDYHAERGTSWLPRAYDPDQKLANWCRTQRFQYQNIESGKPSFITKERIRKLEELDFLWFPRHIRWEEMFQRLVEYKGKNGHMRVTSVRPKSMYDPALANWCIRQRASYKAIQAGENTFLTPTMITKLEKLGFQWDGSYEGMWEESFRHLLAFKELHGHVHVTNYYAPNQPLANWCSGQRNNYRMSMISEERTKRLEDVGFIWNKRTGKWLISYHKVKIHKEKTGNWNVPKDYEGDRFLWNWCSKQRLNYKKGTLSEENIQLLNDIDFPWTL